MRRLNICLGCLILTTLACSRPEAVVFAVGSPIPAFSLKTPDKTTVKSDQFQGRVVVLNFWATWCGPCKKEIPALIELSNEGRAEVVGISLDEKVAPVQQYMQRSKMNYTIVMGNQKLFSQFYGSTIPYTLVVDKQQNLAHIHRGPLTKQELDELIAPLL